MHSHEEAAGRFYVQGRRWVCCCACSAVVGFVDADGRWHFYDGTKGGK